MDHELRNSLTDIDSGYKQVSPIIMFCIGGLGKYCSLVHNIFSKIIYNKFYGSGARARGEFEEKRIYNSTPITIDSILMDLNPNKYNEKDIASDRSNLKKKLNFIHENNILYLWSYSGNYIFFFERDFGAWRVYNPLGVVIPKTIYKIANVGQGAIDAMVVAEDKGPRTPDRKKIELSFMKFLCEMIGKMEPLVAKKFPTFVGTEEVAKYTEEVKMTAENLYEYEGLFEDTMFENRLPATVKENLSMKKKTSKSKEATDEMNELIPKNSSLCKNKATEKKREPKKGKRIKDLRGLNNSSEVVDVGNFRTGDAITPFKDSRCFTLYYHSYLNAFSGGVALEPIKIDVMDAGKILESLTDYGKKNDMFFLKAWLETFCKELRKKDRTKNKKHTSMNAFGNTLKEFKEEFLDPRQQTSV